MRLDKFLSHQGYGSRKQVKDLIRKGHISVNGDVIKNDDYKIDEKEDEVIIYDNDITYQEHSYLMLNKPRGFISATSDAHHKTVMDLIDEKIKGLFLVGRLDIDTEGLLLITNDGKLAHNLLSPKKNVEKKYYIEYSGNSGMFENNIYQAFEKGVILDDGYKTKPARIELLDNNACYLSITEGKFHQVKRMFKSLGMEVQYLKRVSFGTLLLDNRLALGEYRRLTLQEIEDLKK